MKRDTEIEEITSNPKPDTFCTLSQEALVKLFSHVKGKDLTQSQFEANKTQRIVALSKALESCPKEEAARDYYNRNETTKDKIVNQLMQVCAEQYQEYKPFGS